MTITQAYEKYHNPPHLQLHQLRVAAVAKVICDNVPNFPDAKQTVLGCLLHDVGNLIRYKTFPENEEWVSQKGLKYWQNIQQELMNRYDKNEDVAALKIAQELQISPTAINVIKGIDSANNVDQSVISGGLIGNYSDCRVSPTGIVSIKERIEDLERRYPGVAQTQGGIEEMTNYRSEMETKIQQATSVNLQTITNQSVESVIESLKSFEI